MSVREQVIEALASRTQRDLAARSGVAQPRISDFRRGARDLRLGDVERLLAAAGFALRVVREKKTREAGI